MESAAGKKRIAFFDFACCEGCQLAVLELGDALFSLLERTEIVAWREVMTGDFPPYDIAFCEGSIAGEKDEERLRRIRQDAGTLVALGSCAAFGCHNCLVRGGPFGEALGQVYGDAAGKLDATAARPVASAVEADYRILGCPASPSEFIAVFKAALAGRPYRLSNAPVCVECKANDTLCVYEQGRVCLGPLTRCGCEAICTRFGDVCRGCRGLVEDANPAAMERVFSRSRLHPVMEEVVKKNPLTETEILRMLAVYNSYPELKLEDLQDDRK